MEKQRIPMEKLRIPMEKATDSTSASPGAYWDPQNGQKTLCGSAWPSY